MIFVGPSDVFGVGVPVLWLVWFASVVSITVGSLVAIAVVGYALIVVLSRWGVAGSLRSRGLKAVDSVRDMFLRGG